MNMLKPVKAKSVKKYFDLLPKERPEPMEFLHKFIQKTASKLKPNFLYNGEGYKTCRKIPRACKSRITMPKKNLL